MKKVVVLTGAGMSAESGLKTFREMGGLWEEYDISEVATPEAWCRNPELVLRFYNERRKALLSAVPNKGHLGLVELEKYFKVRIITQNVDDLHERAGSSDILHLHGELRKSRSTADPRLIYSIGGWELNWGDTCGKGSQLRPHIVWFGEAVPNIEIAVRDVEIADILVIIGTSMQVYPAAGLIDFAPRRTPIFLIDPNDTAVGSNREVNFIRMKASEGVDKFMLMALGDLSL
ncbi:MAG: NAD-dependent deacylase [Bacteroidales bacterium]|jgi:NAD-dependent deacetylase